MDKYTQSYLKPSTQEGGQTQPDAGTGRPKMTQGGVQGASGVQGAASEQVKQTARQTAQPYVSPLRQPAKPISSRPAEKDEEEEKQRRRNA
jgi:hypothetical protein